MSHGCRPNRIRGGALDLVVDDLVVGHAEAHHGLPRREEPLLRRQDRRVVVERQIRRIVDPREDVCPALLDRPHHLVLGGESADQIRQPVLGDDPKEHPRLPSVAQTARSEHATSPLQVR